MYYKTNIITNIKTHVSGLLFFTFICVSNTWAAPNTINEVTYSSLAGNKLQIIVTMEIILQKSNWIPEEHTRFSNRASD